MNPCKKKIEKQKDVALFWLSYSSNVGLNEAKANHKNIEHRVSTITHSLYTPLCHQVLRSRGVGCGSSYVRELGNHTFLCVTRPESHNNFREQNLVQINSNLSWASSFCLLKSNADSKSGTSSQTSMRPAPSMSYRSSRRSWKSFPSLDLQSWNALLQR